MIRGTAVAVALCAAASAALADQEERFAERIEVSRVLLDVRIVGGNGSPLLGLEPDRGSRSLLTTLADELPPWAGSLRLTGVRAFDGGSRDDGAHQQSPGRDRLDRRFLGQRCAGNRPQTPHGNTPFR
jgi:hypothetical protein